jgi:hypothetical protein
MKTKTKKTKKTARSAKRVSTSDIVTITGESLARAVGGIGFDGGDGGGELAAAGKTWRDIDI